MKHSIDCPNLRRIRAEQLAAGLMAEISDLDLPGNTRGEIYDRILWVLMKNGAHIWTDRDREEAGLEPRDSQGWTPSEKIQREKERIEFMTSFLTTPMPPIIPESFVRFDTGTNEE